MWNPESRALEFGILLKESGIPLATGIQNPSSADKGWNLVPGIRNPRRGIQNPRLAWIPALTWGEMTYRTLGESSGYWVLIVITVTMLSPVFTANPPISEALS